MMNVVIKSFKKDGEYIHLFSDPDGKECEIKIPVWQFNKMVEAFFDVKVKPE